jgi:hypothetical protein
VSNDFTIKIQRAEGGDLRISMIVSRPALELKRSPKRPTRPTAQELEILRSGLAPEALVNDITDSLSPWLMETGLDGLLARAFQTPEERPVRLVIDLEDNLRADLSDLPIELVLYQTLPFVLMKEVNGIIHLLPKIVSTQPSLSSRRPPLRVLLVRTSPPDFNVQVPAALPLRDEIMQTVPAGLADVVEVDVLSSEEPGSPPVTWKAFEDKLDQAQEEGTNYDVLVYLGHGDLITPEGKSEDQARPALLFEHANTELQSSDAVRVEKLRVRLQTTPIPVVFLCGCLTGAAMEALDDERKERVIKRLPRSMRGIQGVAQSLVTESGVQFAVGMRWRLEMNDAKAFITACFRSLLRTQPGDVEIAVRAGRQALLNINPFPPSWSAPVIYRTSGSEPTFPFLVNLAQQPPVLTDPPAGPPAPAPPALTTDETLKDQRDVEVREQTWAALARLPGMLAAHSLLKTVEEGLRARILARGVALLQPGFVSTLPETAVEVPVQLFGKLTVSLVKLQFLIGSEDVRVESVAATDTLRQGGFNLAGFQRVGDNSVEFDIKSNTPAAAQLPAGDLVRVRVVTGTSFAVAYPISLVVRAIEQPREFAQVLDNALIVANPVG